MCVILFVKTGLSAEWKGKMEVKFDWAVPAPGRKDE